MTATPTPGPRWRTGREDMQSYDGATGEPFTNIYVDDPNGEWHLGERLPETVARCFGPNNKERARLIVTAVNNYAALVAALRETLKAVDELMTEYVSKKRAADWGVISDTLYRAERLLAEVDKGKERMGTQKDLHRTQLAVASDATDRCATCGIPRLQHATSIYLPGHQFVAIRSPWLGWED